MNHKKKKSQNSTSYYLSEKCSIRLSNFNSWKREWELCDQKLSLKIVLSNAFDFVCNNTNSSVFFCWIKCQYLFHAQF